MRAPRLLLQTIGILFLVAPDLSHSTTILVPGNQPTIQAGLNAAVNGDTVLVAPGTYTGASNRNLDFAGKAIVLRSSAGAATTIIDCQNAARGFRFHTNETALSIVDGFTVRNANALGANGGGISIESASPTIRNAVFSACQAINGACAFITGGAPSFTICQLTSGSAVNWGGAVYGEAQSTPTFRNCTIAQNTAPFGGAMYFTSECAVILTGCTLTGNTSVTYGSGIYSHGSSLTLDRCVLSQNSAKRGAGLYCIEGSSAALDSCTFDTNTAGEGGGGFFGDHMVSLSLTHTDFVGNRTLLTSQPNAGGGLYCRLAGSFLMEDCTFTGNVVAGDVGVGGGAYFTGGDIPANVTRCIFSGNSAGRAGGAAIYGNGGSIADCEFNNNAAVGSGGGLDGGDALIRCSFVQNHAGTVGGGASIQGGIVLIQDCIFADNTATNVGGALFRNRETNIVRSTFHGNSAALGGAIYFAAFGDNSVTNCTLYDNSASQGAALYWDSPAPTYPPVGVTTITGCTIASNVAPVGAGLVFEWQATISRSIIAFGGSGDAVSCFGGVTPALSCTDIFGNAGGDWTACISDQLGINGNFAGNPRFCAPLAGDFTLAQDSPCSPAHSPAGCGTIGSQPVGCVSPIGITDAAAPPASPQVRIIPNPLRTAGVIEWTGAAGGVEAMRLYDATGRLVLRLDLAPRSMQARQNRLSWSDFLSGKRLAPGVYFLRTLGPLGVKVADENVVVLP